MSFWYILTLWARLGAEPTSGAIIFQKNTFSTMQSFFQPFFTPKAVIWVNLKRKTEIESYFWKPENHTSNCGQQVGCRMEPQTGKLLVSTCTAIPIEPYEMGSFCTGVSPLLMVTLQTLISGVQASFHNGVNYIGIHSP